MADGMRNWAAIVSGSSAARPPNPVQSQSTQPSVPEVADSLERVAISSRIALGSSENSTPSTPPYSEPPRQVGQSQSMVEANHAKIRPVRPKNEPKLLEKDKFQVFANYFQVSFQGNFPDIIFHYDVDIGIVKKNPKKQGAGDSSSSKTSSVPDRLLFPIWNEFEKKFTSALGARMGFDGKKNCYTAKLLDFGGNVGWNDVLSMKDPDDDDRKRQFSIALKLVSQVDTKTVEEYLQSCYSDPLQTVTQPQDVIQALDVVLRSSPSKLYTPVDRCFYSNLNPYSLSKTLDLWFGHSQSLILGREGKAYLNVDMANKAFTKRMSILDLMISLTGRSDNWLRSDYEKANKFLKGKLVEYKTRDGPIEKRHRFICLGIDYTRDALYKFQVKGEGEYITIKKYFEDTKKVSIKHEKWPVVQMGSKEKNNCVPMELLDVVPQVWRGMLDNKDTSAMIRGSAKSPKERFNRIQNSRDQSEPKNQKCPIRQDFGIIVDEKMVIIPDAKRLPLPFLSFKDPSGNVKTVKANDDGKFKIEKFLDGAAVPPVVALNLSGDERLDIKRFMHGLGLGAKELGMKSDSRQAQTVEVLFQYAEIHSCRNSSAAIKEKLSEIKRKYNNKVLVVVIMDNEGQAYPRVKAQADVEVGVLTQCVKKVTVRKVVDSQAQRKAGGKQVVLNILLKVNAKLGEKCFSLSPAIQNTFHFTKEPILFLGADVTHPSANSNGPNCSIAAITASYDLSGMCYQMHVQLQPKPESLRREQPDQIMAIEVITGMKSIVYKMIGKFRENTGLWPCRIIMFRDGVSEGQFVEIKTREFHQGIQRACEQISKDNPTIPFRPKVTFVVVKKRHNTRFNPAVSDKCVQFNGNIPPGTVVDSVITHPTEMEFFLNSHVGIQGTSKSTRYHVLHDDSRFTMHRLELLTYALCYTYARCTQPVSYPAPTYYAHVAAFRASKLLENEERDVDFGVLAKKMTIHPDLIEHYPMFYI